MVCCFVSRSICEHEQLDPLSKPIKRNDGEYKFAEKRTHGKNFMEISFLWNVEKRSAGFMDVATTLWRL
jgi:hypothetical protein